MSNYMKKDVEDHSWNINHCRNEKSYALLGIIVTFGKFLRSISEKSCCMIADSSHKYSFDYIRETRMLYVSVADSPVKVT